MKLVKLLANLGYGSRKEVQRMIRSGAVTDDTGRVLAESEVPPHDRIRVRGEELDPPSPLTIILNKPDGYTCSTEDPGDTIYDLLPDAFRLPQSGPQSGRPARQGHHRPAASNGRRQAPPPHHPPEVPLPENLSRHRSIARWKAMKARSSHPAR